MHVHVSSYLYILSHKCWHSLTVLMSPERAKPVYRGVTLSLLSTCIVIIKLLLLFSQILVVLQFSNINISSIDIYTWQCFTKNICFFMYIYIHQRIKLIVMLLIILIMPWEFHQAKGEYLVFFFTCH